ncbi:MAG: S8 family peptidase, partial [Planctomycetota bacterium]|nr:S8 family peptidase [Planctomycetota bacterium]
MPQHKHIIIDDPGEERDYTKSPGGGGEFRTPLRDRRAHARRLREDIQRAEGEARAKAEETGHIVHDICLEIVGEQDFELKIESLQDFRLRPPIEVLSVRRVSDQLHATIFVPEGKLENFVRKIELYEKEDTKGKHPRPKNEELVAGIGSIRFPVLRSFWTDSENLFPRSNDESIWWEVWIRVQSSDNPDDAFASFVAAVAESDLRFSQHTIKFPERLVFLAHGSAREWTRVFVPLLDRLAELRKAKEVPTDLLSLPPQDQSEFVNELASRIVLPGVNAPSVCLLDFGVHTGHPLLRPLISDEDAQSFDPGWPVVDSGQSHGTEMAGLALFGDKLPELLSSDQRVRLIHRLESVRMLHRQQLHPEEIWGYVTQECLAKAETQAAQRRRVACLAVTANDEGRDHGRPSSWSGAIDQHASGQLDDFQRLYVIAAGNIRDIYTNSDYTYPESNLASSVEDPGQSWNALTVGAFTDRVHIRSEAFDGFQPVAPRDGLCPTSRTSDSWEDKAWPMKPDIVMEGGNYAYSPSGMVDGCEDLALLTTSLDPTGRLLAWSSDTSAATAQAARLAAILMADYPELWPETVRGLIVHSAEWTNEMKRQIPGDGETDRRRRLRCFGYGVPDLDRARYTVENRVSLVHQGTIQPYKLEGTEAKTNHFVLHSLPWPVGALEELHDQDVTVKITLSYFIEPSPDRRGWGKKFRYASHGLRFALRGPTETEHQFRKRISSQEWEEQEGRSLKKPSTRDPIDSWAIGRLRNRGSIHCDWW